MINPLSRIPLFRERKCKIQKDIEKLFNSPPLHTGPLLRFDECSNGLWKGDIMMVHNKNLTPTLFLSDDFSSVEIITREIIDERHCFYFTKWTIQIKQQKITSRQDYYIKLTKKMYTRGCFFIPGRHETWRWIFFSCNDLSHTSGYSGYPEKFGGVIPLWSDLVHKHNEHKYHMMVGLGDQVYMDEVFEHVDELEEWTLHSDRHSRERMACPVSLAEKVDKWVMFYYLRHFSQPYFEQALTTIPHVFVISDHDIYDGQGSYPEELENSPVLTKVRNILQEYYLLFQQHTHPSVFFTVPKPFGDGVAPFLKQMGDSVALLGLDTRFERTRHVIIKPETYDYIFDMLSRLPESVMHLVVATEIPLIFPDLRIPEKAFLTMSNIKRSNAFNKIFKSSKLFKKLGLPFGEPLLLTDMIDHWNSINHIEERNNFIFRLQKLAKEKNVRVTFIGGDVHCAGVGRFATPSEQPEKVRAHYENRMLIPSTFNKDHKLMYQIISSAIANIPPPSYIIKMYHMIDKKETLIGPDNEETDGRMLRFFLKHKNGKIFGRSSKKLMGRRNFCSVQMSDIDESLFFELYVEMFMGAGKTTKYSITVPALNRDILILDDRNDNNMLFDNQD